MNGKKARAIRKNVEALGKNVREVAYAKTMHAKRLFNPDGSVFMQLFTTKRTEHCGRSMYKQAKLNA